MSHTSRKEYIESARADYSKAKKAQKTIILDHMQAVTKLNRKYLIRVLASGYTVPREKAGRPVEYDRAVLLPHVKLLWFAMEQPGPLKLKAALPDWLDHYQGPDVTAEVREFLRKMSYGTLGRFLSTVRFQNRPYGISTTRGNQLLTRYPVRTVDWNRTEPGNMESDTVAHCGDRIEGEYAHSVNSTCISSTWTETRATWTKAQWGIQKQLEDIELSLPFFIISWDFDNGSEFFNETVLKFIEDPKRERKIQIYRSRPYRKNDQCFIEQKNLTHVRNLFGYDRIAQKDLVPLMNEIYKHYWCPLNNFFIPTMKLIRKERIGAKIKKTYDKPRTPYRRVLEMKEIPQWKKDMLSEQFKELDPFLLKEGLERRLKTFFTILNKREMRVA